MSLPPTDKQIRLARQLADELRIPTPVLEDRRHAADLIRSYIRRRRIRDG